MDEILKHAVKKGCIVHLPNGMKLRPIGKRNGSIEVLVRLKPINAEFCGKWINFENKAKTEEIIGFWNTSHSNNLLETNNSEN